jgi:hypothetical protein
MLSKKKIATRRVSSEDTPLRGLCDISEHTPLRGM